jgi:RimJ/RimL family protein N-acetyltransferase
MIVRQYGVTYHRLRPEHLEMLRYWRNQEYIRNTMQFKDYITPAMQLKWFDKINNKYNYYFIIEHEGKKIGLINCKDTEPDSRVAEGGIFIWEKDYWGTPIPAFASLTLLQAVFEIFKTGEASVATVACDNKRALEFNSMLGYEIKDKTPDGNYYKLYLSKEKYMSHCKKLIRAAAILHKDEADFKMEAEPADNLVDEVNEYLRHRSA